MDFRAVVINARSQTITSHVINVMLEMRENMQHKFKQTNACFSGCTGNATESKGRMSGFIGAILFLVLQLWHPGEMGAQPPEEIRLSLGDALYYSLKGNQDIQISSFIPLQAHEDLNDARSVYAPSFFMAGFNERLLDLESLDVANPTIDDNTDYKAGIKMLLPTGGNLSMFWETRRLDKTNDPFNFQSRYANRPTLELKQPLLKNFGSRAEKAAIRIQNNNVNISEAQFQQKVQDVVAQVSRIYWELYKQRGIMDINQKTLVLAEEIHRREVVRLAEGISKPLDVARALSNTEARRAEVLRSRESVRVVTEQLKFLINWSDLTLDSDKGILAEDTPQIEPVKISLKEAIKTGLHNRPEMKMAFQNEEIAGTIEDLARHQRLPKLNAVMSYSASGLGSQFSDAFEAIAIDDQNDWTVGLELEIPIGNRSARAIHRKRKLISQQTVVERKRVENQIKLEIKEAVFGIDLATDEIESSRLETQAAKQVVDGELERFELGQMTNEELLRAQDFLADAQRKYIQAVVKYNIALSDLDRARSTLPNGLEIESNADETHREVSETK